MKALVSPQWLLDRLDEPNTVVLDATLAKPQSTIAEVPNSGRRLPSAQFFDINGAFSAASELPHMMCDEDQFRKGIQSLGINHDSTVVVYDAHGVYSSPRAWWMLRSMGLERVAVLDGGLPHWVAAGYPTEPKAQDQHAQGNADVAFNASCFMDAESVLKSSTDDATLIMDARSRGRFDGTEPEPRQGLRGGHIPGSVSLPFSEVLDGPLMKPEHQLKAIFETFNPAGKQLVFSCGSGLTACIILLAGHLVGYDHLSVYDGSWSEWGQPSHLPVATTT